MKRCLNCFNLYDENISSVCSSCGIDNQSIKAKGNSLQPGTFLDKGRYIIGKTLNSGGFGVVYQAFDTKLEIIVAIKEFFPSTLATRIVGQSEVRPLSGRKHEHYQHSKENFIFEARIMMKFNSHKNIVNCMNYFEENNTAYIVMEFLEGCSVKQFISINTLDLNSIENISLSVMDALECIHNEGYIFRDVAPDNIFICSDGVIKLIDFGAAIPMNEKIEGMYEDTIIKPGYAPIEQYRPDGEMGAYTDIYALGATIYRMLSGTVPFESTDRDEYDDLPILKAVREEIPEHIDKTVMKALAVQPKLRFKSIDEFRKAFKNEKDIEYIDVYLKKRKKLRKIIFASIGVLCVCLFSLIGFIIQKNNEGIKNIKLKEDTITVALPYQNDEEKKYIENIIKEFNKDNPEIYVELTMYTYEEYDNAIVSLKELPNVFVNNHIIDENRLGNMNKLLDSLNDSDYFCFNKLNKEDLKYRIPLSFEVSVAFVNTAMDKDEDSENISIDEVIKKSNLAYNNQFILTIKDKEKAKENYNKYKQYLVDKSAFLNEEVAFYIGSSKELKEVASKLSGYWDVKSYENKLDVQFFDYISIAKHDSENKENASMYFVYELLSDFAQNSMYIQINNGKIPVNQNTLDFYLENCYSQLSFVNEIDNIQVYEINDIEESKKITSD